VEVRVLFGASKKAPLTGVFHFRDELGWESLMDRPKGSRENNRTACPTGAPIRAQIAALQTQLVAAYVPRRKLQGFVRCERLTLERRDARDLGRGGDAAPAGSSR
jgi:hypothetical protein